MYLYMYMQVCKSRFGLMFSFTPRMVWDGMGWGGNGRLYTTEVPLYICPSPGAPMARTLVRKNWKKSSLGWVGLPGFARGNPCSKATRTDEVGWEYVGMLGTCIVLYVLV